MNKYLGITLIVLALALAVVPFFTDCQSQGNFLVTAAGKEVSMKCHWTGVAEIGVTVPLLLVGILTFAGSRKTDLRNLGVLAIFLGGMAIAFPAGLIGVCQTPTMVCNTAMKPALTILGSLSAAGGLGIILTSRKETDKV